MRYLMLTITIYFISSSLSHAQFTYFNQVTGQQGDEESNSSTNIEVVDDSYIVWGSGIDNGLLINFIRKYNFNGEIIDQDELIFPNEYVLAGIINSFKWNPFNNKFVFIHGSNQNDGSTEGLLIEFDENLDSTFTKRFSQYPPYTYPYIFEVADNGYIVAGEQGSSMNSPGTFLMKLDFEGNVLWDAIMQPEINQHIYRNNSIIEIDNNYLLAGGYYSGIEPYGTLTITNDIGETLSVTLVEDEDELQNPHVGAIKLDNGEILVAQAIPYELVDELGNPNYFWRKIRLYKFDPETEEMYWQQDYHENYELIMGGIFDMAATPDGGALLLGARFGNFFDSYSFIIKIDSAGNEEWFQEYTYEACNDCTNLLYDIELAPDGGYVAAGKFNNIAVDPRNMSWLLKVDACGDVEWQDCQLTGINEQKPQKQISLYPNPCPGELYLKSPGIVAVNSYALYDMAGRLVSNAMVKTQSYHQTIQFGNIAPGIYLLQLYLSDGSSEAQRLEIIR